MTTLPATPRHASLLAGMLADFNAEYDSPTPPVADLVRRLRAMLGLRTVLALLSGDEQEPSGFALVTLRPTPYSDGPLGVLDELYVIPERRGHGLGSELMAALEHELRARGCGELHINVDEEDAATRRFYDRHGYANTDPDSASKMLLYLKEL